MVVVKSAIFVLLVGCVVFQQADAFLRRGRRRRRRCTPTACQVSQWSSWSSCSAFGCGQQGSEQRSRTVVSSPSCGGAACPGLAETRLCYSSTPVDCQLSSWSEWSVCSTPCGVSGTQSSDRHRITTAQCGGTCTSTFQKTRACPELSCLNEGILKDNTCFCKDGYGGVCCEKSVSLDCQLSSWSEWSACTTQCGVSGTQSSERSKIRAEKGGTCTSVFRKTRACPELSCLNGGSLEDNTCVCKMGFTGVCCEKKRSWAAVVTVISICGGIISLIAIFGGRIRINIFMNNHSHGNKDTTVYKEKVH